METFQKDTESQLEEAPIDQISHILNQNNHERNP